MAITDRSGDQEAEPAVQPGFEPSMMGRRVAVSSFYMVAARLGMRGIGLVSTLVLVRILSPTDFGIVALAQAVYAALDVLTTTGFGLALIRMHKPTRAHYDTVWTLNIIRGAFIAVCLVASSGWQAAFMHEPRIQPLMWMIAGTVMVGSLGNVRMIEFQRDMQFDFLMVLALWRKAQIFGIAMLLTIWLDNYWILILANFGNRLISVPISYLFIKPYRPRFSIAAWRELFHFSKWLFLGNICTLADSQVMNFIVGHYLGVTKVGVYQVGNQIAGLPLSEIAAPIRQPFYTAFARLRHDLDHMRRVFLDGLAAQCLIIVPMTVGIACTAPEISGIFLGSRWAAVVPLLPFIALHQLFDAGGHYTHNVLIALNRQKLFTITYYLSMAVRIPLTIWFAFADGLRGAVIAMVLTSAVNAVLWNTQVNRLLRISARRTLTACWRPLVASGVMAAVLVVISPRLLAAPDPVGIYLRFGLKVAIGAAIYFVLITAFWLMAGSPEISPEAYTLRTARSMLGRVESMLQFRRRPAA